MLRHCVALLAVLVAGQVAVHADDEGECTKAGYAAKFGALPVYDVDVHALEPTLDADDGTVALSVSYASPCGARSVFAASLMHKLGMDVILLERAAPSCEGVAEDGDDGSWPQLQHTVRVALPSEARGKQLFLAFPPDSVYEVYALGQWPLQLAANESIASPDALAGVGATGAARADAGAAAPQAAPEELPPPFSREYDFLVVGSGIAGLTYALKVARYGRVAVVTKAHAAESSTRYAQGGISAVWDPADSVESHMEDTHVAGGFLCDARAVEVVCSEGPGRVRELIELGARFSRRQGSGEIDADAGEIDADADEGGEYHLAREGGHRHSRILHAADMTGREIERALLDKVRACAGVDVFEHTFATRLLKAEQEGCAAGSPAPACLGVDAVNTRSGVRSRFLARTTLVAAGGAGQVYPSTTNPAVATGDGIALCMRAGAAVTNMEFIQFHPTALYHPESVGESAFLITEAVRGAGGRLYNLGGERFMPCYDARAELAPRDVVARAIDDQLKARGDTHVLLDISHRDANEVLAHFPNIAAHCKEVLGLDITRDRIPVVPAAHYFCGGVSAGLDGETAIGGLFICGEAACTGLHGANRLASNSLLEGLVFAHRAAEAAAAYARADAEDRPGALAEGEAARSLPPVAPVWLQLSQEAESTVAELRRELQALVWRAAGIVRTTESLERGLEGVRDIRERAPAAQSVAAHELHNLLDTAEVIMRSALQRRESRGLHYTLDHPEQSDGFQRPTTLGEPECEHTTLWLDRYYERVVTETEAAAMCSD